MRLGLLYDDPLGPKGFVDCDQVKESAKLLLGVDVDLRKCKSYDPEKDTLKYFEAECIRKNSKVVSETIDLETSITTIVIEYYLDSANFVVAKKMKYKLKKQNDLND